MKLARLRHIVLMAAMLGVLISTHGGLLAHVLFIVRQDYIARHLCENRHIPHSHCHGKCFLKKRMAQAANQAESGKSVVPPVSPVFYYLAAVAPLELEPPQPVRHAYSGARLSVPADGYPHHIDPPPRLA